MKTLALIALLITASGCTPPVPPIAYECPKIILPPYPHLPIKDLKPTATPNDAARAAIASLKAWSIWAHNARAQVENSG